jgi:hypothetical protein
MRKIRIPLDHSECDALDLRIYNLLLHDDLTDMQRGRLLKERGRLRLLDPRVMRVTQYAPLPCTRRRPQFVCFFDMPSSVADCLENYAGYLSRIREFVESVEVQLGLPINDDI